MKNELVDITAADAKPDVLRSALTEVLTDASWWYTRAQENHESFLCQWTGQSRDGRKRAEAIGKDPFPWEGASDQRIRTVDEIENDHVKTMLASFFRSRVQAVAMDADDVVRGERATVLLKWVVWGQMRRRLRRELEIAARWRQRFGLSISHICYDSQYRLIEQPIDIAAIAEAVIASTGQPADEAAMGQATEALMLQFEDELLDEQSAELIKTFSPIITAAASRRMVREIRETGTAMLEIPEVYAAQPRWQALLPFVDVFFPMNTDDIQDAPWIAHRELISETDLRARIETEDYDAKWVEEAIKHKGDRWTQSGWADFLRDEIRNERGFLVQADKNLIEIWHFSTKTNGPKNTTAIYETVLHHSVKDGTGKHALQRYDHGKFPYVTHVRENISRTLAESRGIAEIAATWQDAIKTQHDSRSDRTDLSTIPALRVPLRRGLVRPKLGPKAIIPEVKQGEITFMDPPRFDGGSIEIESSTERMVDRYFGRVSASVPPERAVLHAQDLVDGWLLECNECVQMCLQLTQQYMPESIMVRVSGPTPRPQRMTRAEIQGQYDLTIEFDSRNLNEEFVMKKLDAYAKILPMDRQGRVELGPLVEQALQSVDPYLASSSIRSAEAAEQKETDAEMENWKAMVSGIEPPLPDGGGAMNYQLRLQTLMQIIQSNPEIQQMIQQRPILAEMVQNRIKSFEFQVQQGENAQIGRQGAGAVLQEGSY